MTSDAAPVTPSRSGTTGLILVMIASIVLSVGGVVYAICWGVAADGGRGGAIAVALSFGMLFLGRRTPESALEARIPKGLSDGAASSRPGGTTPEERAAYLETELVRVRNALASMLDWQSREKVYLTISSVVGTLAWGFGDVVAKIFGAAA